MKTKKNCSAINSGRPNDRRRLQQRETFSIFSLDKKSYFYTDDRSVVLNALQRTLHMFFRSEKLRLGETTQYRWSSGVHKTVEMSFFAAKQANIVQRSVKFLKSEKSKKAFTCSRKRSWKIFNRLNGTFPMATNPYKNLLLSIDGKSSWKKARFWCPTQVNN